LFGFDGDLYDRKIEVALHAYIRDEMKFDGIEPLIAHMKDDEAKARHLLALD
jgi:riboflavin kinase / FMN adenylyltransferase